MVRRNTAARNRQRKKEPEKEHHIEMQECGRARLRFYTEKAEPGKASRLQ